MNGPTPLADPDELVTLVRRASTLDEVLAGATGSGQQPTATAAAARRAEAELDSWCRLYARGDREAFRRRLAWDGLSEAGVQAAFERASGEPGSPPSASLPPWASWLLGVRSDADPGPGPKIPYWDVWRPFVAHARRRLEELGGGALALFSAPAMTDLEHHLGRLLAEVGAATLHAAFKPRNSDADVNDPGGAGRASYLTYVKELLAGGLEQTLLEYPVLARQLSLLCTGWAETSAELARRLAADLDTLAATFNGGAPPGQVTAVRCGLSDRHHGGRQVAELGFASGLQLIYKPRDMTLEGAYNGFLGHLRGEGLDPCPPALRVLARPGYGWTEKAVQATANTRAEAGNYYRRAGGLLCIAWLLGGRDLHMENVIATREGPVVIDAEAFLQPVQASRSGQRPGDVLASETFLVTGLLAFSQPGIDGDLRDVGGLRGAPPPKASPHQRDWTGVNTDAMRLEAGSGEPPECWNLLFLGGRPELPEAHPEDLEEGFTTTYQFLVANRDRLLDELSRRFTGVGSRLILRPSNVYAGVLLQLTTPQMQRHGPAAGMFIDSLNQVFRQEREKPLLWPLAAEERRALEALDLPVFSVDATATTVHASSGEPISGYLAVSGLDAVSARLRRLGEADLDRQLATLAKTLDAARSQAGGSRPGGRRQRVDELLIREATAIGDQLLAAPVDDTAPDDLDLYTGATGLAVFFAALARATGEDRFRQASRSSIEPVTSAVLDRDLDGLAPRGAIGVCTGLGSVIYGCSVAAGLLADATFSELAVATANLISDELVEHDELLDVSAGSAGAILGLLALEAVTGSRFGHVAEACARHLLRTQEEVPAGGAAWAGSDGLKLAGFAHGAAGIACSLARLHGLTGDPSLPPAVAGAMAYERTLFSESERNWPVLLASEDGATGRLFMSAWCHGAPGIALSRLWCREAAGEPRVLRDLETAVATTLGTPLSGPDHLCCGTMGRVDVILTVGRVLGREALVARAERWAVAIVQRATAAGGFAMDQQVGLPHPRDAGLFRGIAGIGYELLRLANPEIVPSVLAFDPPREGARP